VAGSAKFEHLTVEAVYGAVNKLESVNKLEWAITPPCITARRGGRAIKNYCEASADREAGVVFRREQMENHPGCVSFGGCAKFS